MIGKRIVLYLVGISVLLLLVVLVLAYVSAQIGERSQDGITEVETGEVVLTEDPEQVGEERRNQSRVTVTLRTISSSSTSFYRVADLFVSNGQTTAGENSLENEVVNEGGQANVFIDSGIVKVEYSQFDTYDDDISASVVGLLSGRYELTINLYDASGAAHQYIFATSTDAGVLDTYTFNLNVNEFKINRLAFSPKQLAGQEFEDDNGLCDVDGLKGQLDNLLVNHGWDMNAVPLVHTEIGLIDSVNSSLLPFGIKKVCAVRMNFKEDYTSHKNMTARKDFVGLVAYTNELITVGDERFGQNPADGPLGSSNVIPFSVTGDEVQMLFLNEQTDLIPINFPTYSTCPCAHGYTALLTAPMYPEE